MFYVVALLLVANLILLAIVYAIRWFWAFLGRGKPLQRAIEEGLVSEETEKTIHDREVWRATSGQSGKSRDNPKPKLTWSQRKEIIQADMAYRDLYLDNLKLGIYQIIIVFVIGSILGLIIEQIWTYVAWGATEKRYGLVFGPFSPLYGAGAVVLTLICWPLRKKDAKWWVIFLISMVAGGVLEQITGWGMKTFFNAESWSYLNFPDHITQWVCWRFLFFWGILGLFWGEVLMPQLIYAIGQPTTVRQAVFIVLLCIYLGTDIFLTIACFQRSTERDAGIPPDNAFEEWVDTHYSDEFIESRFENMTIDSED